MEKRQKTSKPRKANSASASGTSAIGLGNDAGPARAERLRILLLDAYSNPDGSEIVVDAGQGRPFDLWLAQLTISALKHNNGVRAIGLANVSAESEAILRGAGVRLSQ